MNRPGPQVNFKFSVKPEGGLMIDGYDVFENGVKIENPPEDEPYGGSASPLQYFASAALYDLFYVAQTLHGPIHILHYVLTNALKWGAGDSKYKRLSPWADVYNSNVNNKYQAVATVLISTLTGNGLLTSPNGLGGSNPSATVMVENIEAWGACSTVYAAIHKIPLATSAHILPSATPVHIFTISGHRVPRPLVPEPADGPRGRRPAHRVFQAHGPRRGVRDLCQRGP